MTPRRGGPASESSNVTARLGARIGDGITRPRTAISLPACSTFEVFAGCLSTAQQLVDVALFESFVRPHCSFCIRTRLPGQQSCSELFSETWLDAATGWSAGFAQCSAACGSNIIGQTACAHVLTESTSTKPIKRFR